MKIILISALFALTGCVEKGPTTPEDRVRKECYNKGYEAQYVAMKKRPDKDLLRVYEDRVKHLMEKHPHLYELCKEREYEGWKWAKEFIEYSGRRGHF
ncbi:MAG: hypothetical protein ACRC0G_08040 [Fusobacteriaceae bacterium]